MFEIESLKGIIPPIATPLTPDEKVDAQGMKNLIDYLLDAGVHGIFVLGSTGEFPFLTDRERARAVEAAVDAVNGRVPVIAGISDVGTRKAIEHCRAAITAGADFVITTAPYFGSTPQAGIERYVRTIVEESDARVMLYNLPQIITDISPETIAKLAELENVVGIKDSGPVMHIQDVIFRTRASDFRVLEGMEYYLVAALLLGAHGGTPSPANIYPRPYVELYEKVLAGEIDEALELQEKTNRFVDFLDAVPPWSSALKTALRLMGICGSTVASPQLSLNDEETQLVQTHLQRYGLLT